MECIKDGFPASFLRCQYPQAAELSINADVSTSEPGRSYLHATDGLGPVSFPSSYGEYADVRIGVICNFAPDDELDDNGNPSLHLQRDTNGNFYNVTMRMRNLFTTMQTMMTRAGFLPDVAMLILLATVVVMDMCMLMGPTSGWSDTKEYHLLLQLQLPFAKNIIAYVLSKCENLVGVMVFGQKAYNNILPWLRTHYSQKFLIQNVFLSHPQNIRWRYILEHTKNYIETFRAIMNLLGVDIPPLEGVVQLRFFMTKKRTLEMMECVEEFVDSEVLKAVHQRTDKVKIARMAKVEEMEADATLAAAVKMDHEGWCGARVGGAKTLKRLNRYKGSGGNKKLPPRRILQ
jgi:hypothetical protein